MAIGNLVIGLGTGRCGSTTLANLLHIGHETEPRLIWSFDVEMLNEKLASMEARGETGDVGMYYLNYVCEILRRYPNTKFVCMKRNKQDTIISLCKKTGERSHVLMHYGASNPDPYWDLRFPKYEANSKEEACEKYWDNYYYQAERLQEKYPDNFRIFAMEELNSEEGQDRIFLFIGKHYGHDYTIYNKSE